jgi:hypothetical protein
MGKTRTPSRTKMLLNRRPWDNLETPDKIQMLTQDIAEIHDYLLTTNQYKQQMELVIEIIKEISKTNTTKPLIQY